MEKENVRRSIHPYDEYIPEGATTLIIGTIPPERFCKDSSGNRLDKLEKGDVDFYYGSKDNKFWELVSEARCVSIPKTKQECKDLLKQLKMGITDIIQCCGRKIGKEGKGKSGDGDLDHIELKSLDKLLSKDKHKKISTLIYTSEFVKCQVNKFAYKGEHWGWAGVSKKKGKVKINDQEYSVYILTSPSDNALRRGPSMKNRLKEYKDVFGTK